MGFAHLVVGFADLVLPRSDWRLRGRGDGARGTEPRVEQHVLRDSSPGMDQNPDFHRGRTHHGAGTRTFLFQR